MIDKMGYEIHKVDCHYHAILDKENEDHLTVYISDCRFILALVVLVQ